MKIVAVLQTRYNSTRLPGKACVDVNGLPLLWHVYRRLLACKELDEVCVAVGCSDADPIIDVCDKYGMHWMVGEEKNLLTRIIDAAVWCNADAVLRVRADCLFLDPNVLDFMVRDFKALWPIVSGVSNWPRRYCSEGLDAEVVSMETLIALDKDAFCPREDFATYAITKGIVSIHERQSMGGEDLHMSIDTEEDWNEVQRTWSERNATKQDGPAAMQVA